MNLFMVLNAISPHNSFATTNQYGPSRHSPNDVKLIRKDVAIAYDQACCIQAFNYWMSIDNETGEGLAKTTVLL